MSGAPGLRLYADMTTSPLPSAFEPTLIWVEVYDQSVFPQEETFVILRCRNPSQLSLTGITTQNPGHEGQRVFRGIFRQLYVQLSLYLIRLVRWCKTVVYRVVKSA